MFKITRDKVAAVSFRLAIFVCTIHGQLILLTNWRTFSQTLETVNVTGLSA